jgi:hypothetical protein
MNGSPTSSIASSPLCSTKKKTKSSEDLKLLKTAFSAILTLAKALAKHPGNLSFPNDDDPSTPLIFTRKDLKIAETEYINTLRKALKHKKTTKKSDPAELKGQYKPVILGQALQYFFNNGNFGQDGNGNNVIDLFPTIKQGYALQKVINELLFYYIHIHGLKEPANKHFIRADDHMMAAFGGSIPAEWAKDQSLGPAAKNGGLGINTRGFNTFDLLKEYPVKTSNNTKSQKMNKAFDPQSFNAMINFVKIIPLNVLSEKSSQNPGISDVNKSQVLSLNSSSLQSQDNVNVYNGLVAEAEVSKRLSEGVKIQKKAEQAASPKKPRQKKLTAEEKRTKALQEQAQLAATDLRLAQC